MKQFTFDDDDDSFGGARDFLSQAFNSITNDETLADDTAWLVLNNGDDIISSGEWRDIVDSNWHGEVGEGDQLFLRDESYAGGIFVDIVSHPNISARISDDLIEYDADQAYELRDESSRMVAIGKA